MGSKWFNSTIILIFSVGLVVGSLGCHLILSDRYGKTQEDMSNSIEALNKTVQDILGNIISIALKVERLEGRASDLNMRVDFNEYSLEGIDSDLEYIDHRIDLLEEKYKVLVEENEENLVQIREKDEHISHLYSELGVTDGCRLYLDHEVMFEYPEEMNVSEKGTRFRDASSLQGVVSGSLVEEERFEIMVTIWEYDFLDYYRENVLNELDNLALFAEYGFEDLQVGEVMETGHLGHIVYYRDFTAVLYDETIHGRLGAWFCTQERRIHVLLVFVDDVDYESSFLDYLASFRCHK